MEQGPTAAASLNAPEAATKLTSARAPTKFPLYDIVQLRTSCRHTHKAMVKSYTHLAWHDYRLCGSSQHAQMEGKL